MIFIDGDVILHPRFVKDHIDNRKSGYFITGSRVLVSQKETYNRLKSGKINFSIIPYRCTNKLNGIWSGILSKLFSAIDQKIFNVRGCNMSFWKKDLEEINGFEESIEGWGREDSEIVQRLLNSGKTKLRLKFAAIQYHLFHSENDRSSLNKNEKILIQTISEKRVKAVAGLEQIN